MRAYSYLRFSNAEQINGDSFRRQTEASDKYIAENGLILDTSLNMQDMGRSAYDRSNITKGALGSFLKAVEQGRVEPGSVLIVESLDRLSRTQVTEALVQFMAIINAGISIVTLSDGQKYSRDSLDQNPYQLIISITIMFRAYEESAMKSKRVSQAWQNKKKMLVETGKLLTRRTPYWIEVVDGKPQLIPERAEVVKRIYDLARQGIGGNTIIRILNKEVKAWNKVGRWQLSYVHKVLSSVSAFGAIDIDGEIVKDYYPAIVTQDEWNFITAQRKSKRTSERSGSTKGAILSNIFTGC